MNLGQIVHRVQRQFGDSSGALLEEADIISYANEGQIDIVEKTDCLKEHRQTNGITDDGTYDLPTNFLKMKRVTWNDRPLDPKLLEDLDLLSREIDSTASSTPLYYYQWGRILTIFPKPSVGGSSNLDIWYTRTPVELVEDADVPEVPIQFHPDIVDYCLSKAKELDDDMEGSLGKRTEYEANVLAGKYDLDAQPINSYPAIRVLPGDM